MFYDGMSCPWSVNNFIINQWFLWNRIKPWTYIWIIMLIMSTWCRINSFLTLFAFFIINIFFWNDSFPFFELEIIIELRKINIGIILIRIFIIIVIRIRIIQVFKITLLLIGRILLILLCLIRLLCTCKYWRSRCSLIVIIIIEHSWKEFQKKSVNFMAMWQ